MASNQKSNGQRRKDTIQLEVTLSGVELAHVLIKRGDVLERLRIVGMGFAEDSAPNVASTLVQTESIYMIKS